MKGRASRRVHEIHVYNSEGSTWVVVVHGSDGRFRSKDSYGNESPRHDTEQ